MFPSKLYSQNVPTAIGGETPSSPNYIVVRIENSELQKIDHVILPPLVLDLSWPSPDSSESHESMRPPEMTGTQLGNQMPLSIAQKVSGKSVLYDWYMECIQSPNQEPKKKEISIGYLDESGNIVAVWIFTESYPKSYQPMIMEYMATEIYEFAFKNYRKESDF